MTTKICPCCGQPFQPRPQVQNQIYCSSPACQRERRQAWQRKKLQDDRFYRENQQDSQKAWRARNPDYSRNYRATNRLLGDDLKQTLKPGARLKIAASCFSMYAFEALKAELEKIDELTFIFTSPTFVANEVTDKIRKERKEFHIPKADRERSLYGSEFEIQLRNKLTQRAIAKECADWM